MRNDDLDLRRMAAADWPNREHSRFVESGRIRWHVQVTGSGPVMLLLHGTGASTHSFRALVPILAPHFTLVLPDLPGHAYSIAPRSFWPSLPATAAATAELLGTLGVTPAVVVGHSAGAAVAVQMKLDGMIAPRLLVGLAAALVPFRGVARSLFPSAARLLAIAAEHVPLRLRTDAAVARLVASMGSSLDPRGLTLYRLLSDHPRHAGAVLAMMSAWELDALFANLARVDVEMLLLAGARDLAVPLADQYAVRRRLADARLVIVERAGHLLHEERPETVGAHILAALGVTDEAQPAGRTTATQASPLHVSNHRNSDAPVEPALQEVRG